MKKGSVLLTAAAAVLAASLGTPALAEEKLELSYQTMYNPAQTQMQEVFAPFAKEIGKRSGGSLQVNLFGVGTLVPPNEEADSVKAGNLDMGMSVLVHPKETPYTYLIGMIPDICTSIEGTAKVGPLLYSMPEIKKEFDRYGVPFGYTSYMPQTLASVGGPIRTPADLKGKRMLVTAPNQALLAEAWGAIPVMVSLGDVYIGLQRGMGEVYMSGISWHKGSKIFEVAKDMTIIGFPNTNLIPHLINKDVLAAMSDNQRKIFMETADEYFNVHLLKSWNDDYDNCLKIFADAGVKVYTPTPEEMKLWHEANAKTIPMALARVKELGVKDGDAFLERVNNVLAGNNL